MERNVALTIAGVTFALAATLTGTVNLARHYNTPAHTTMPNGRFSGPALTHFMSSLGSLIISDAEAQGCHCGGGGAAPGNGAVGNGNGRYGGGYVDAHEGAGAPPAFGGDHGDGANGVPSTPGGGVNPAGGGLNDPDA